MVKFILEAIVLVLHIYSCFLQEEQIFKSCKWGRPHEVYESQLGDVQMMERSRDVWGMSVKHIFQIQFTNTSNLL